MFYPVLDRIKNKHDLIPSSLIHSFDQWLGLLPPFRRKSIIPQAFTADAGVEDYQADTLFRLAQDIGLFRPVYSIFCPECEELVDAVHSPLDLENSVTCLNGHIFVPAEYEYYVRLHYEVLIPPVPPKKSLLFNEMCKGKI